MAAAKKKFNRRSNLNLRSPPSAMASPPPFFSPTYKLILLITSLTLIGYGVALFSTSVNSQHALASETEASDIYTVEVVNEFPHDPEAFTQGLLYAENDTLFESTGLNGHSSVRKVSLQSGKVLALHNMKWSYFGEGLTLIDNRLFQVTWKQNTGFVYDRYNFSKFEKFTHEMQDGWGLATDGKDLFGTDGTSALYRIDPHTYRVTGKKIVKYKGHEVQFLNELEYIKGQVWANVWQSDCIARISPKDGTVLGWILLHNLREGLLSSGAQGMDVLNGIAWDKHQNRLFVTGKLWPKLFEIKVHPMKTNFGGDIKQICIPPDYEWS